jgi:hypothetical protein
MEQIPLFEVQVPTRPDTNHNARATPPKAPAQTKPALVVNAQRPHVRQVIERAIQVLGVIDQDVYCLTPDIPAKVHYLPEDNGLQHKWRGRVWLNAPPGRAVAKWAEKLWREYEQGEVTEAIGLFPGRANADWWEHLKQYPFCAVHGKLVLIKPDRRELLSTTAEAVVYLGSQLARFATVFEKLGAIYIPYLE